MFAHQATLLNAGLRIKGKWHDQCKLLQEAMKNGTRCVSRHGVYHSRLPSEIAILDHEGTISANTEIDHRTPINKLDGIAKRDALINSLVINKIYGEPLGAFVKSPRQLAKALIEAGINKDSVFIEWLTNWCDLKMLKELYSSDPIVDQSSPKSSLVQA